MTVDQAASGGSSLSLRALDTLYSTNPTKRAAKTGRRANAVRVNGCRAILSRCEATSARTAFVPYMRTHPPWPLVEFELAVPIPDGIYQVPLAFVLTYCTEVLVLVVRTGFAVIEAPSPPYEPRPEPARTILNPNRTPAMTPNADLPELMDTHYRVLRS